MEFFASIYHDRATGDKPNPKNVHLRTNDEYSGDEIVLTEKASLVLTVLSESPGIHVILGKIAQAGYRLGWKKALESRKRKPIRPSIVR